MKTFLKFVWIGLASSLSLWGFKARAVLEIGASVQINAKADFIMPLAAHGSWVEVRPYGQCWHPAGVAFGWRPYCDGQWVWTDCGWYWESDEPWAWACYHYGRWVYDSDFGWVWVPGIEWAPAWVYWRTGGGYIGWAPCPPAGVIIEPTFFAFVEVGHFCERVRPRTVIVNNTTIINKTTVINNVRHATRTIDGSSRIVVVNEGPGVETIQKSTGKKVSVVPIQEAARHTPAPSAVIRKTGRPASREKTPAALPQEERPTKSITPNAPPSKDSTVPPGKRYRGERGVPPTGPANPSGAPPVKPAEPPGGDNNQGQQKDKGPSYDKDKP